MQKQRGNWRRLVSGRRRRKRPSIATNRIRNVVKRGSKTARTSLHCRRLARKDDSMSSDLKQQVTDALLFAQGQVRRLIETHPGFYPLYTDQGKWRHDKPAWTKWCDGFLPGMMWLFLEAGVADDPKYWRTKAEENSGPLGEGKEDRDVHELRFIFSHWTYQSRDYATG